MFEARFGPIGAPPTSYWAPHFGHAIGLKPADMGDLTPAQLMAAHEFVTRFAKGAGGR